MRVAMLPCRQYALRIQSLYPDPYPYLLPHFPPQEPITALHVAAPQQEAAMLHTWSCQQRAVTGTRRLRTVPMAGIARNGSDRSAPMIAIWRELVFGLRCDGARGCA
jgi:hypothetical protein